MSKVIAERQAEQKDKAVEYYSEIPILKHAAAWAGIDERTIQRWRDDDPDFAARLQEAKATFVRRYGKKARPEFMLERLDRDNFGDVKRVELVSPIAMMIQKFGLDVIEGEVVDGQNDGDVQIPSPENS